MRARLTRRDGYMNRVTGHGTSRDSRGYTEFATNPVTDIEGIELWRGNDIASRIVEKKPTEALRRGFSIVMNDKERSRELENAATRLHFTDKLIKSGCMERAAGGSAMFPVFDGVEGVDLSEPLDESRVGRMIALHVLEPRELWSSPSMFYKNLTDEKFGMPETYRLVPLNSGSLTASMMNVEIHESRLIVFPGRRVTRQVSRYQRPGWGDSELTIPRETMSDYGISWAGVALLLSRFGRQILRMDGFAEMSANGKDSEIQDRLDAMMLALSALNLTVCDKDDEIVQVQTAVTGLSDLLVQLAQRLAAAADMPLTILMGMSPAGMNATGDMDIRAWYDRCATLQTYYLPMIMRFFQLLMLDTSGGSAGVDNEDWSVEFAPLWQPSAKEQADERKSIAETDEKYVGMGLPASTVFESRWKGGKFSPEMSVDFDAIDAQNDIRTSDMTEEDKAAMRGEGDATATTASVPDHGSSKIASAASAPAQNAALNGAQVAALVQTISDVASRVISRESGAQVIMLAYNVSLDRANEILGPTDFVAAEKPSAPSPFVGKPEDVAPATSSIVDKAA